MKYSICAESVLHGRAIHEISNGLSRYVGYVTFGTLVPFCLQSKTAGPSCWGWCCVGCRVLGLTCVSLINQDGTGTEKRRKRVERVDSPCLQPKIDLVAIVVTRILIENAEMATLRTCAMDDFNAGYICAKNDRMNENVD